MIKKIIAAIATLLALWAWYHLYTLDKEVDKLNKISALIKSTAMEDKKIDFSKATITKQQSSIEEFNQQTNNSSKDKEIQDKLKALKEKAGNIAPFEVSPLYKKKCASCHGNIGEGIIGPKLIGKSEEFMLKNLQEFKSGKRKNYVMYGLLSSMSDEDIASIAKEVSTFEQKLKDSQQK